MEKFSDVTDSSWRLCSVIGRHFSQAANEQVVVGTENLSSL